MAQSTSTSGNQPLIELKHVDKHYGDLHVLNDINLSVDRGEVVVVIGPFESLRRYLSTRFSKAS